MINPFGYHSPAGAEHDPNAPWNQEDNECDGRVGCSALLGVKRFRKPNKPKNTEYVIWIWASAGQVTAGDYYKGQPRDAAKNYEPITDQKPTHWMPWPDNWPDA